MVEWRDSLEYRWCTWSTPSSCVLERSREATMVARVHVASKYYIQTMLSLGRCLLTTNISYAIIRCTVAPTVSPAWSQGMPGTYIIYIVRHSCLSRGLEWVIRVYARRQCITFWSILYRTMYVPPFNYNILTDIPIPAALLRSPAVELTLNGIHNNFPQSYTTSSSPLIYTIQIQNKTQEPGVTGFHASFFIIKNTT